MPWQFSNFQIIHIKRSQILNKKHPEILSWFIKCTRKVKRDVLNQLKLKIKLELPMLNYTVVSSKLTNFKILYFRCIALFDI